MRRTSLLLSLPVLLLGACAVNEAPTTTAPAGGATTKATTSASRPAGSAASSAAAASACSYPRAGTAAKQVTPPSVDGVKRDGTLTLTFSLSGGDVSFTMNRAKTPCTANAFESLVAQKYFDGTECHRLTTSGIYVLQCGDPSATGRGGPGYSYADEVSGSETYPAGTVAMANAGPNTNGSQFFFVYKDSQLPPKYTVLGTMDAAGLAVVDKIAAAGADGGKGDGKPKAEAKITAAKAG